GQLGGHHALHGGEVGALTQQLSTDPGGGRGQGDGQGDHPGGHDAGGQGLGQQHRVARGPLQQGELDGAVAPLPRGDQHGDGGDDQAQWEGQSDDGRLHVDDLLGQHQRDQQPAESGEGEQGQQGDGHHDGGGAGVEVGAEV